MKRKVFLVAVSSIAVLTAAIGSAHSQEKVKIVYSDTVADSDMRSKLLHSEFGACLGDQFDFQPFHGATMFKQGTELVAMQRGNLDMGSLAIYDFYNQVPSTSILGTGYIFRDYAHMRSVMDSDLLADLWKEVEDKAQVKVIVSPYVGTRHLGLKGTKKIMKPADLAGVNLRMPGGEGWQFLGQALGGNPTPMAFAEVYTALQTGAIDGQDNPLPAAAAMKFNEVINQVVLTGHMVLTNQYVMSAKKWNSLTPDQQQKISECGTNFQTKLDEYILKEEEGLVSAFKDQGLDIYEPDRTEFRKHVLEQYQASKFASEWPSGLFEKIDAVAP